MWWSHPVHYTRATRPAVHYLFQDWQRLLTVIMVFCLLFLSVISTLTSTSSALSCVECKDTGEVPCTGATEPCLTANEVCISKYAVTIVGGVPVSKIFTRGCGDRAQCSESGSMSVPLARVITSASCCYTNGCNPPRPVLPVATSNKNGVVCKSCQTMDDSPCESDTYMECIGDEKKCISQVTRTSASPTVATRGCATQSLCNVPHEEVTFGNLKISADTTCTDGSASLHYCLYLLAATFMVLFKVMN